MKWRRAFSERRHRAAARLVAGSKEVSMKSKFAIALTLPVMALALAAASPAFAQDDAQPASQSMRQAGEAAEQAGSYAGTAAKDAYLGTKTAIEDTTLTAKVKKALYKDDSLEHADIHVETVAGVVTLTGAVPTIALAQHAQELAQQTSGVKSVNNQLSIASRQSSLK
jgi:hyperosmotically inducible periplasmic protein